MRGAVLSIGSRAVVDVYLPVRVAEIADDPAPAIGLILGVSGVLTAVATFASSRLVDANGGIRWFMPAMVLAAATTIGIAIVPSLAVIAALTWVRALPFAAGNTLLYAHLTRVVSPADQTAVLSLTPTPRNTAMFVLPILGAAVAPFGVGLALGVGALAYLAAAATGWLAARATPAAVAASRPASESGPPAA